MRGVTGLELEILIAKSKGEILQADCDTPLYNAYCSLEERGLLVMTCKSSIIDDMIYEYDEITSMGRIVLAASLR